MWLCLFLLSMGMCACSWENHVNKPSIRLHSTGHYKPEPHERHSSLWKQARPTVMLSMRYSQLLC